MSTATDDEQEVSIPPEPAAEGGETSSPAHVDPNFALQTQLLAAIQSLQSSNVNMTHAFHELSSNFLGQKQTVVVSDQQGGWPFHTEKATHLACKPEHLECKPWHLWCKLTHYKC